MAIVIKKIEKELEYTPISQLGQDKPFMVVVKPISTKELMLLEDKIVKREGEELGFYMGKFAFNICKASLVSWKNIVDEKGKDIKFEIGTDGLPSDDTIASMGIDIIQEVSNVVTAISRDRSKIEVFFPSK